MIVVIGGGVTGLASACAIADRGHAVCVIERRRRLGLEASTHNSGVIHAGLYHPPDSLKSLLCHEGRERLYAFCREFDVPHIKCGKLIVGGPDERADLDRLLERAAVSGARLEAVDAAFVREREPHISAAHALWSPETGWVDADAFIRALEHRARALDVVLLTDTSIEGAEPAKDGIVVITPRERIDAEFVVNAAGLHADEVSKMCGGEVFTIYPCRGEYAMLAPRARSLVRGLVYPVPHASGHGLGVHLTRTMNGEVWIGPTIAYQDRKDDYENDRLALETFLEPTRLLLPDVTMDDLRLGGSGIRAKLHPASERFADFMIRRDVRNPRLIHAAGIESPGLTASLAIGERVVQIVRGTG